MRYYDLPQPQRKKLYTKMQKNIREDMESDKVDHILKYASDSDTYIRKNCYLILARFYQSENSDDKAKERILNLLNDLSVSKNEKIRQTAVYCLGEIGKKDFPAIEKRLDIFLNDVHHSVKNGLTGALKQMGEKNPVPTFKWAKEKIKTSSADMKKRILHGLELRGRTHPEELLPILKEVLQKDKHKKTKEMIIHIIGQISYKKGCLEKVITDLRTWEEEELIFACKKEIIKVHKSYERFSFYKADEAAKHLKEI